MLPAAAPGADGAPAAAAMPLLPGQLLMLHTAHGGEEPAHVTRLLRTLGRGGHTDAVKPRMLAPGALAVVRLALARPLPLDTFADNNRLGRFVLRYGGRTVAAGIVLKIRR
jgi:elongation factor 1 alpha-like protein